jgi:hypothetical protein
METAPSRSFTVNDQDRIEHLEAKLDFLRDILAKIELAQKNLILRRKDNLQRLADAVYIWAGRPTKDGAKNLRKLAAELTEDKV